MQTPARCTIIGITRQIFFAGSVICALVAPLFAQGNNWQLQCDKLFVQGAELERQGDYANAGFSYTECRDLAKLHKLPQTEASALHRLAVLKARSKKFSESAELFRSAIVLDKKNVAVLCDFAQLYADRRMYDDAETILKNALLLEPNNTQVLVGLGMTIAQQRDREAEGCRYLKLALGEARGYKELAKIYRMKGNVGQAEFAEQKAALAAANPSPPETLTANNPLSVTASPVPHKTAVPSIQPDSKPPVPFLPATPPAVVQHAKEDLLRLETKEIAQDLEKPEPLAESAANSVARTKPAPPTDPFPVAIPASIAARPNNIAESAAIAVSSAPVVKPSPTPARFKVPEPIPVQKARTDVKHSEPLMFIKPKASGTPDNSQLIKIATAPARKSATDVRKNTSEPSLQKIPDTPKRTQNDIVPPVASPMPVNTDRTEAKRSDSLTLAKPKIGDNSVNSPLIKIVSEPARKSPTEAIESETAALHKNPDTQALRTIPRSDSIADTKTQLRRTPVAGSDLSRTQPKVAVITSLPEFKPLGGKTAPEVSATASQPVCNEPERSAGAYSKAEFVLNNRQGGQSVNNKSDITLSQPLKKDAAPAQETNIRRVPPPHTEFAGIDGQQLLRDALNNAAGESVKVADNARHTSQGDLPKYTPIADRPATEYQFIASMPDTAPNVRSFGIAEKTPQPAVRHIDATVANRQVLPPQVLDFSIQGQEKNQAFAAPKPYEAAPVREPVHARNEPFAGYPPSVQQETKVPVPEIASNVPRASDDTVQLITREIREEPSSGIRVFEVVKMEEPKPVPVVAATVPRKPDDMTPLVVKGVREDQSSNIRFSEVVKTEEPKPVPVVAATVPRKPDDIVPLVVKDVREEKPPSIHVSAVAKTEEKKSAPAVVSTVPSNANDMIPLVVENTSEEKSPSVRLSEIVDAEESKLVLPESVKIVKSAELPAGFATSRARKPKQTETVVKPSDEPAGFASSRKK